MTDEEIISVVSAHKEGKKIQGKAPKLSNVWVDLVEPISWDFVDKVYRVAPEPRKPREWNLSLVNGQIASVNALFHGGDFNQETVRVREVLE